MHGHRYIHRTDRFFSLCLKSLDRLTQSNHSDSDSNSNPVTIFYFSALLSLTNVVVVAHFKGHQWDVALKLPEDDLLLLSRVCCSTVECAAAAFSPLCCVITTQQSHRHPDHHPSADIQQQNTQSLKYFAPNSPLKKKRRRGPKYHKQAIPLLVPKRRKEPALCSAEPAPQTWVTLFRSRFSITSSGCWVLSVKCCAAECCC